MEQRPDDIAGDEPVVIPLRRATPELLTLRNQWERRWAVHLATHSTSGIVHEAVEMTMLQLQLWMRRASDEDLSDAYRKWGKTPRQHINDEERRALGGWIEEAM
jgi:isocitrate dehydrogenase kinase/phosphatase